MSGKNPTLQIAGSRATYKGLFCELSDRSSPQKPEIAVSGFSF
jgi:hypothetical protein